MSVSLLCLTRLVLAHLINFGTTLDMDSLPADVEDRLEHKRAAAKAYLGASWVGHPDYVFNPRHSNAPDVYIPARRKYIREIAIAGRMDRSKSHLFHRAVQIRKVLACE